MTTGIVTNKGMNTLDNGTKIADFKYDHFFELTPDLLCIAGYDGYFKKINPSVSRLLGYSMEELYARPINDFVFTDDKEITAQVREELTKSKPLYNFENRYLTKSGDIVWLSWTSLPVDSDQLVYAIAKNVTHKKRLEAERNATISCLAKINEDLRQLTYTTSHDLRTPVNNLLAVFQLIDTSKISDQETLEFIGVLQLAGEQLKQSLNHYVDLLKEKHHVAEEREEIDLQQTLDRVLQSIMSLTEVSKTTIDVDFSCLSKVTFNKAYLESIFLNLVTNSIKYARPACSPVISIRSQKSGGVDQLIISDNGLGFDLAKVGHEIFKLHQTFHHYPDSKGIGLYLVHSHITRMGGKISVESKINEGTTFTISF